MRLNVNKKPINPWGNTLRCKKNGQDLAFALIILALQAGMVIVMFNLEKPNTL